MSPSGSAKDLIFAVLIPAFNEAPTIRAVAEGALAHVDRVIVIDDGSEDGTADAVSGLPVDLVRHSENAGKGHRLSQGIAHAVANGADAVISLDADGQHAPADIPVFQEAFRANPDAMIIGDRTADRANMPMYRQKGVAFGDFFLTWATDQRLRDGQCGMRVYPAVVNEFPMDDQDKEKFTFENLVLLYAADRGIDFIRVPIKARYLETPHRHSHYRPRADTWLITKSITRFIVRRNFKLRGLLIALGLVR
ncbi:MAG: glycosyltransferase family 2 protein [Pseudomonadota bacterium]